MTKNSFSFFLLVIVSVAAFVPTKWSERRTKVAQKETKEDLKELAKKLNPLIGFYDPLNLCELDLFGMGNEATIGFLRHAEIKHGRVAMLAFVGYIFHSQGYHFQFALKLDGSPFPSGTNPPQLWDALPDYGKLQILAFVGLLEFWGEVSTPERKHYMKGGKPGEYPDFYNPVAEEPWMYFNLYDPFREARVRTEEEKGRGLLVEINNGRAAMFGILAFLSAQTVPGSVPVLNGIVPGYDGEVMAPFSGNILAEILGS